MRGRRAKQADEEVQTEGDAVEVIDVSAHEPRRIPSKKWRELIKKVWDPSPTTTPNRSWRSPPPETPGSARVRLSHPLFSGPQPSGGSCV